jgi:hypothetical protein
MKLNKHFLKQNHLKSLQFFVKNYSIYQNNLNSIYPVILQNLFIIIYSPIPDSFNSLLNFFIQNYPLSNVLPLFDSYSIP